MTNNNVLIVEDEPRIRHFLRMALEGEGIRVMEACSIAHGVTLMSEQGSVGLVILDLGLPDGDGVDFIRIVRDWSTVPILVLSARNLEADKVNALDAGADDYLAKPFGIAELLARVRALRRRREMANDDAAAVISFGDVVVDRASRTVTRQQATVHLTPREYHLLLVLLAQPNKVITQRQLLREVWGAGHSEDGHYVRIYMGRLRQKLENNPAQPKHLLTETGIGYRFAKA
ncbi:MAG: hypothetical protein RI964_2549 [Pseudomonadota bacterium]|jgi:two-component system KDP operon response regulator KdpE